MVLTFDNKKTVSKWASADRTELVVHLLHDQRWRMHRQHLYSTRCSVEAISDQRFDGRYDGRFDRVLDGRSHRTFGGTFDRGPYGTFDGMFDGITCMSGPSGEGLDSSARTTRCTVPTEREPFSPASRSISTANTDGLHLSSNGR